MIRALNVAREGGGGLGPFCAQLVALAKSGPTHKQKEAIMRFALDPGNLQKDAHVLVGVLVVLASATNTTKTQKDLASVSLAFLAQNSMRYHDAIREAGGIPVLLRLARSAVSKADMEGCRRYKQRQGALNAIRDVSTIKALARHNTRNHEAIWEVQPFATRSRLNFETIMIAGGRWGPATRGAEGAEIAMGCRFIRREL